MICEIIRRLGRKALIVVHNLTQLEQMVDDVEEILGITPRSISGKKGTKAQLAKEDDRITVINIDSRDKITDYTQFGTILLDECDMYLGSDDRREWVGSLSAEYQYGLTGTIKIQYIDDQVFELYYGKKTELKLLHLTPKYQKVLSAFTYTLDDMKDFHELKKAMYENQNRNTLIINTVLKNKTGRKGLVFCDSVDHAKFLENEFKNR
jgi:superfamily II DNA or RNA helicase